MTPSGTRPRVAFVYPPYGPLDLPSLGLSLLSASLRRRGFECRTFYWNLRFTHALPGYTLPQKQHWYRLLSLPFLAPWNEWLFTRNILAAGLAPRDAEVRRRLARLDIELWDGASALRPSELVLGLCHHGGSILAAITDELGPYDIVGIGTTFSQNGASLALAKSIKERWPGKTTVLGGANCDGEMGRALIEHFPFLDCVFSGEVDHSVAEFVQRRQTGAPLDDIPGLLYRDDRGRIHEGPPAPPIQDMNALPVPDFDDYLSERKAFGFYRDDEVCLPLESSRGCWWGAKSHCTFCGLNGNGMAFRHKDPARFRDEVETVVNRYGSRYLFMADNILSTTYYRDFLPWAKARNIGVEFFYEIKANTSRQQVAALVEAGITTVQPGIESFSTKILSLMRKGTRGIQNVAFLKFAREYGIHATWNILAGFPGEDVSEYDRMARQVSLLVHLQPPYYVGEIEFHRFSPYHRDPDRFGLRLRSHEKYSFIYPFEEASLARLAYVFQADGGTPRDPAYLAKLRDVVSEWTWHFNPDVSTLTWAMDGPEILVKDRRPGFERRDYRLQDHAVAVFRVLDQPRTTAGALRVLSGDVDSAAATPPGSAGAGGSTDGRSHGGADPRRPAFDASAVWAAWPWPAPWEPSDVAPEQAIAFTEGDFATDPAACLRPLVAAGIVFEDDGWYLALPVHEHHRPLSRLPEVLKSTLAAD
jgi:ribosomal peptide maturation radical SAM protein 1